MAGRKPRYDIIAVVFLLAVVIGVGVFGWIKIGPYGKVGSTYIAKQMCSCVFVAGRPTSDCRTEFKPDVDKFSITIDRSRMPREGRVKASLGGLFTGEARYEPAFGCTVVR